MAIRNNNMRKIPNYDPTHVDHLRKIMQNCQRGAATLLNQLGVEFRSFMLNYGTKFVK